MADEDSNRIEGSADRIKKDADGQALYQHEMRGGEPIIRSLAITEGLIRTFGTLVTQEAWIEMMCASLRDCGRKLWLMR